jgi:transcriptional regulator with XRE-family HTH domain
LSVVVADNVRLICARRRITQVDLAEVLGMSKMSVSDRFRYVAPWTVDDLGILSEYLGVPVGVLLGEALSMDGETDSAGPLLVSHTRKAGRQGPGPVGQPLPLEDVSAFSAAG